MFQEATLCGLSPWSSGTTEKNVSVSSCCVASPYSVSQNSVRAGPLQGFPVVYMFEFSDVYFCEVKHCSCLLCISI